MVHNVIMTTTINTGSTDGAMDLHRYDAVVISSSAGKDSQAMLTHLVELARAQGYARDRLVVVHADLSELVEWDGVVELARAQAEHYGLRFDVVTRVGQVKTSGREGTYKMGETFGPIPEYAERRQKWPGIGLQWCTSDYKTAPIRAYITKLAKAIRGTSKRQVRILSCLGLRAQESKRRAKRAELITLKDNGNILLDEWLPIQMWSVQEVWACIHASGVPYHEAYDLGMRRLSCCFCIGASMQDLLIAGSANPSKLREYVAVEDRIGFTFQPNRSLRSVMEELDRRGWNVTGPSTAQHPVEDNEDVNVVDGDTQPCDAWDGMGGNVDAEEDEDEADDAEAEVVEASSSEQAIVLRDGRIVTTAQLVAGVVMGGPVYRVLPSGQQVKRAAGWRWDGALVMDRDQGLPACVRDGLAQVAAGMVG